MKSDKKGKFVNKINGIYHPLLNYHKFCVTQGNCICDKPLFCHFLDSTMKKSFLQKAIHQKVKNQ